MTKSLCILLLLTGVAFSGTFNFTSSICNISFDSRTNSIDYQNTCWGGGDSFRLECGLLVLSDEPWNDPSEVTFLFIKYDDIKIMFSNIERKSVRYSLSGFARLLETGKVTTCQISYNANPEESW